MRRCQDGYVLGEESVAKADFSTSQGMLASAGTIETIAETLKEYDVKAMVLDPVCHDFP